MPAFSTRLISSESRNVTFLGEIARLQRSALRSKLQQKLGLVERVLERIDEVRAML